MTLWNPVGAPVTGGANATSLSLSVSPANIGDVVFVAASNNTASAGPTVAGGGVSSWNNAATGVGLGDPHWDNLGATNRSSLWWGIVTATGAQTLVVTNTGGAGLGAVYQEFAYTGATAYAQDVGSGSYAENGHSSGGVISGNFGPVTPSGSGLELLVGVAFFLATPTVSGVVITQTAVTGFGGTVGLFYALDVDSAGGPYSPSWSFTSANNEADFTTCFEATPGSKSQIIMIV